MSHGHQQLWQTLRACARRQPVQRDITPFSVSLERPPFRLRRYHLPDSSPGGEPLLLVYSTINRPDLLDLSPRRSMIRRLLDAGYDVYLVDWGEPLDADSLLDLEDYLDGFLLPAVRHLQTAHGLGAVNAAGICQGGTLLTCFAAHHPDTIAGLVNLAAPLAFSAHDSQLARLAASWTGLPPEQGNVPGQALATAFGALRPTDLWFRRYYDTLPALGNDPTALDEFLHMEAWMYDCPDQPAVMFDRFVRRFYQEDALARGELRLGGKPVRLDAIRARVLSVHARQDHLVPPASTRLLADILPAERYQEMVMPGGHLGLFVGGSTGREVVHRMTAWLQGKAD